jgi:RND family efflux transporter MFP subunit
MTRKYLLPLIAAIGFAAAVAAVILGNEVPPAAPAPLPSAQAPFENYVAGTGLIEASTGNIAISTPVSGIVDAIYVKWGDWVSTGQPLFKLEARDLSAQLEVANAKVQEAEASLAKSKNLLKVAEGLTSGSSISLVDLANRRFDVGIFDATLAVAKTQADQIDVDIERHTIRAPVDGRVLQINTHLGEFAQSGMVSPPLMLFGGDSRLYIRVDVDENDAWRVQPTAPAMAYVPGNPELRTPLRFERIERYVVPKTSLTGASTERTDTRVLQAIYSFDHGTLPVYIGQRMNVFIEAPAVPLPGKNGQQQPRKQPPHVRT